MPYIILLNGPPRCGKDTYANNTKLPHIKAKFANEVKRGTHAALGLDVEPYHYESSKDIPVLNGITPRAAYIAYSEKFMKPLYGKQVFGKKLAIHLKVTPVVSDDTVVLVTDSGFSDESSVLLSEFGVDKGMLVRVERDGCNFDNDSRSYIELPCHTVDVTNDGTIADLVSEIDCYISEFINN